MLLSLNWLREFVPYEGTAEALGERLTMLGLELEDVLHPYEAVSGIVIGHVLTCEKHPQSDHLSVCSVDVGEGEPLPIVCGAPNVAAGQKVPVAKVGVTLPDGLTIKAAKLRGLPSHGMICSERELGLSEEHSGIMVLPERFRPGERLIDALDLDREVLEIGITPNRGDCLSVLGFARETALAFGLPLTMPQVSLHEEGAEWADGFEVRVPDPDQCPAYRLRLLQGVTIGPSPAQMRYRLHAVGIRPISNVVDVTNYILMELGQPLHAFDRDKLKGNVIEVSSARAGEHLVTLDGQDRALCPSDLLIRDGAEPVALAGVMGGLDSEITEATRNVLVECAVFRPDTIRRTARRLALTSEASYRFERGVDQVGSVYALERAADLMARLSGGTVRPGICVTEGRPWSAPRVRFRPGRAGALLGCAVSASFCAETFEHLGCRVERREEDAWEVAAPSWRHDVTREADLVEEIARVYGMDELPETLPRISRPLERFGEPEPVYEFLLRIKRWASGLGLNEAENYSFVGHGDLDCLDLSVDGRVSILNPLSEEQNVLRTELTPGLLLTVRHNLAHGNFGLRLFEVAKVFYADPASETTVSEGNRLALAMHGPLRDTLWPDPESNADYVDMRGIIDHLSVFLHVGEPEYERVEEHSYLSPCVRIRVDGEHIGVLGRVRPKIAEVFHARNPLWTAELNLDVLARLHAAARPVFQPLPVYPSVSRDITVMAPVQMSAETVRREIAGLEVRFLEQVSLIDVFEPADKEERNLTFRLVFRHPERTLKDGEVDKEREKAARLLVQKLGVRI